jgi:hypothetical protein
MTDVLQAAGQINRTLTTAEQAAVTSAIAEASAWVEQATASFFEQRHLQVTTEPSNYRCQRLFMPAPLISIDSNTIVEAGVTLTLNTDFYLYTPSAGASWLERARSGASGFGWAGPGNGSFQAWSNVQQGIVVNGMFGFATTPPDITKAVAWVAAQMLGWVTVSFQAGDGVQKAVLNLKVPDWVEATMQNYENSHMDEQFFNVTVLS